APLAHTDLIAASPPLLSRCISLTATATTQTYTLSLHDALPIFRAVTRHDRMVGTAVTVVTSPNDNLLPYLALPEVRHGDILVIATGGMGQSCALLGGTILGHLKNAGARGVATDGFVRDLDEIEEIGLPVYAAGCSTRAPTKSGGGAVNVPVAI